MSDNLDNQVEYVRSLAIAFRMAISRAQESGELSRTVIASFPRACCGYTSDLLQRYLDKHGIKHGMYLERIATHQQMIRSLMLGLNLPMAP